MASPPSAISAAMISASVMARGQGVDMVAGQLLGLGLQPTDALGHGFRFCGRQIVSATTLRDGDIR